MKKATEVPPPPMSLPYLETYPVRDELASGRNAEMVYMAQMELLMGEFDEIVGRSRQNGDFQTEHTAKQARFRALDLLVTQGASTYNSVRVMRNWIIGLVGLFVVIEIVQHLVK